jgi:hypothetical protein
LNFRGDREMKIVNTIEEAIKSKFCLVEMASGHRHTIKAYGEWNQWTGSDASDLENQKEYIEYIAEHERTEVDHYEVASSKKDAVENEIIDSETLGFL